jgi:hypothetical protein
MRVQRFTHVCLHLSHLSSLRPRCAWLGLHMLHYCLAHFGIRALVCGFRHAVVLAVLYNSPFLAAVMFTHDDRVVVAGCSAAFK